MRAGRSETERRYERREQPLPQLGRIRARSMRCWRPMPREPTRERLTFQRMFEELRLRRLSGRLRQRPPLWPGLGATRGRADGRSLRAAVFAPGEAYQFDWSHECVVIDGVTTMAKVAQMRLCHSRMLFVRAYPREAQEMVFDAHEKAFAVLQGRCRARHLRQHEDGGRRGLRRQGAAVQSALRADDEPSSGRADGVHAGGGLGEGAGREPGRHRCADGSSRRA